MLGIADIFFKLIDKIIPDPKMAMDAKLKAIELQQNGELKELDDARDNIIAETKGESWLQRNWRPITMLSFVTIIVNNYIIYPYLKLFWHDAPLMEIPTDMWGLLKIGIGGYIVSRGGEKMMRMWTDIK